MKVLLHTIKVVFVHVLISWWTAWELLLHYRDKLLKDFIHLVSREQVGHLAEILTLDLLINNNNNDDDSSHT